MFPSTSTMVPYQTPQPGRVLGFILPFPSTRASWSLLCCTKASSPFKATALSLNRRSCTRQIIYEYFLHSHSLLNNVGGSYSELSYSLNCVQSACTSRNSSSNHFMFSNTPLTQDLNSKKPVNDPWGTLLYTTIAQRWFSLSISTWRSISIKSTFCWTWFIFSLDQDVKKTHSGDCCNFY